MQGKLHISTIGEKKSLFWAGVAMIKRFQSAGVGTGLVSRVLQRVAHVSLSWWQFKCVLFEVYSILLLHLQLLQPVGFMDDFLWRLQEPV